MPVERVHLTREGRVALVRLERPPVNALTPAFLEQLSGVLAQVAASDAASVVLTGTGTTFSAGLDLRELPTYDEAQQRGLVDALNEIFLQLYSFSVPTVAGLNGHAVAGGLLLALCCDYRIAPEGGFRFGLAEVRVGVPYPQNAMAVVRAELSAETARDLALLGVSLSPRQALVRGVVDELCEAHEVRDRALEAARGLGELPRETFRRVKGQLRRDVFEEMRRVVAEKSDPARTSWITQETAAGAAKALGR